MLGSDPLKNLPGIVVVDGATLERDALVRTVAAWGYPVEFASNGQDALALIQRKRIQLVLVDLEIPGMQGIELCSALRSIDLGQYTYIILMSAQNDEDFLINALDAGADDVLSKPVDASELEARLQSAVRRIKLQAQMRVKTEELSRAHDVIAQDLRAVSVLQRSFLPEPDSPFPGLSYHWLSVPSKYVSGDHLQMFELLPGVYGFYLLDVSGHGIPAAVKSMQLVQMFMDHSGSSILFEGSVGTDGKRRVSSPRDVVSRLNRLFQQTESDVSYFTMIYGVFNTSTCQVSLCQAGHPSPLLLSAQNTVTVLGNGGYPVGLFDLDDFEDIQVTLGQGDALLLYSDGVTEVLSTQAEVFGEERLLDFLAQQIRDGRWAHLPDLIQKKVQQWGGEFVQKKGFEDDISILMLAPQPGVLDQGKVIALDRSVPEPLFMFQDLLKNGVPEAPPAQQKKSIVIVDDSPSFLKLYEVLLKRWGYNIHSAKNGHEALELIQRVQPDFVLTDWDMPEMSGIELCEQVRAQTRTAYTYIIMITGYASRDDLLNSLRVGADDFMTKPVNPGELKVRLQTAQRIVSLHTDLERRHHELSQLYDALQRDMREVSRIQRALLPKSRPDPWPLALQTIYQPQGYVCGKQMGLLETPTNEQGFFLLSLPGEDTATALQAMALARWFSLVRATRVLFPLEQTSSKIRRYLAKPEDVLEQLSRISPSLNDDSPQFDLLYGLINLDQGSLLVAGIGGWRMVLAQPGTSAEFFEVNKPQDGVERRGKTLYHGVIAPGSRLYFYSQECARTLGVPDFEVWKKQIFLHDHSEHSLTKEFSRLLSLGREYQAESGDSALLGLQWRESSEPVPLNPDPSQLQDYIAELNAISLQPEDEFYTYPDCLKLGEYRDCLSFTAVADTVNIGVLSNAVREFVERLAYSEGICYNADLVVSEALTNVIVHGFKGCRPAPVKLTVLAFKYVVGVVVEDHGASIPAHVLDIVRNSDMFQNDLPLGELPEGGMGLTFMRMVSLRFVYRVTHDSNKLILLL